MMSDNHDFCRVMLQDVRREAKQLKIKIPKLISCKLSFEEYAIFAGNDYEEFNACCSFYAKAEYLNNIISFTKRLAK